MAKGSLMAVFIRDLCESICVCGSFSLCHWAILHGDSSLDFVRCHELKSPETWFWGGDWCTGSLLGNVLVVITCGREGHEAALGKGVTGLWRSLTKSLANPPENSEARMALQSDSELGQGGQAFIAQWWCVIGCGQLERNMTLRKMIFSQGDSIVD